LAELCGYVGQYLRQICEEHVDVATKSKVIDCVVSGGLQSRARFSREDKKSSCSNEVGLEAVAVLSLTGELLAGAPT
jgi:hypothetical protein